MPLPLQKKKRYKMDDKKLFEMASGCVVNGRKCHCEITVMDGGVDVPYYLALNFVPEEIDDLQDDFDALEESIFEDENGWESDLDYGAEIADSLNECNVWSQKTLKVINKSLDCF